MEQLGEYRILMMDNDAETYHSIDGNIEFIEELYNNGYEFHSEFSPGTRFTFAVFKRSLMPDNDTSPSSHEDTP